MIIKQQMKIYSKIPNLLKIVIYTQQRKDEKKIYQTINNGCL